MWAIPAKTSRGRNAKLNVLLTTIMSDTWLACDEDVDYDAEQARKLLLEFAGDEVSEPWTARFARPSERIPGEQARTNDDLPKSDRSEAAASVMQAAKVVDLLRTCYVREGWKIDEEAAERALAYCRAFAADGFDPDDERQAAIDFFCSHGISLDWVFDGKIGGLICGVAKNSARANACADAALIAIAEQYVVAEQKWCDLNRRADDMAESTLGRACSRSAPVARD